MEEEEGSHILCFGETFLREGKIPSREGGISDSFPAVFDVCFAGNFEGNREVVEGQGEIEAVFRVSGDLEGHFLIALPLEETGDFVFLVVCDVGQYFGGGVHVATEDEGLIFDNGEREVVGDDVDVFVCDVGFAITGEVTEEVHGLVEMRDCVGLVANEIVETVSAVGIDEAVADPLACAD